MEFEVHITETLMRRVALRRLLRPWPLVLFAAVLIGVSVYADLRDGRLGKGSVAGLTAIAFLLILYTSAHFRQQGAIADWKRLQGDAPVHYRLSPDTIHARSNLGSSELRWNVFRALLEHREYFLLSMGRSGHLTLPRHEVPTEALAFIRERFSALGIPAMRI